MTECYQPLGYKIHKALEEAEPTKQYDQDYYNNSYNGFPPSPFTQERTEVQKGIFSLHILQGSRYIFRQVRDVHRTFDFNCDTSPSLGCCEYV